MAGVSPINSYQPQQAAAGVTKPPLRLCPDCNKWRTRRPERCRECQAKHDAETLAMIPTPEEIASLDLDF